MQSFYEELSPLVKHIVIGYADHESNMQIQKLSSALMRNRLDHFNFNYTAMRGDIQGLRCIAIVAVLIFHLWPQTLKNGYLGVDMFFVISGFLMHAVLEKKDTSPQTMLDFYFRRIRRIWPTYYFILTVTILAVPFFFVATDYKTILNELLGAATFTSNIFNLPDHGYFAANNNFPLFLHTWSLSVEMQFYLLVPLIFYIYRWCTKSQTQWLFIGTLTAASLLHQLVNINDANKSHMAFFGRVWQFMVGFIIFTHSPLSPLKPTEKSENDRSTQIGDISYSLYLTHWPIIICTKYITLSWTEGAPFRDGVFCISMALLSAFVIESVFKKLTACIDSFFALSACLLIIFTVFVAAAFNVMARIENPTEPFAKQLDFANQTRAFFHSPAKPNMTEAELLAFNEESGPYFSLELGKKFQNAKGRFSLSNEYWEGKYYGSFEGDGNKNILIIGNSISRDVFYGLLGEWKDVYKRLTLYFVNTVVPFQNVPGSDTPKHDFLGFLDQFEHPIDILIVRN
uniref:Acyl_transf_3 domain-containing protein n=1 Tax=Bursaphelenchus xylophilus TaxID=6326 RepID=A0A1I7SGE9_BURXY